MRSVLFKPDTLHFLHQDRSDSRIFQPGCRVGKMQDPSISNPCKRLVSMSSGQNPSCWAGTHKWKGTRLHELSGTKCLSLHCLYFSFTCGLLLCSSGETVTSVTSMSPLQPKKVKKKKEKEKLEEPPAIPAKGMKTNAEVFQILNTTMKGQQSVGCQGTLPLTLPCLLPSMGKEIACVCFWDQALTSLRL